MINFRKNDVILFQGDSITDGNRGRNEDLNHVMGHGYQYIAGAEIMADNIGKNVRVYNRGISGNRISDLYGRWIEDTLNLNPTVLSILIGVNDILFAYANGSGSSPERYEKIYRLLLDEALEKNPEMILIIMEPFVGDNFATDKETKFFASHAKELQKSARKIAGEYNALFIPLQDMFDEYKKIIPSKELIWDGIHPTITGHELIARRWLEYVKRHTDNICG